MRRCFCFFSTSIVTKPLVSPPTIAICAESRTVDQLIVDKQKRTKLRSWSRKKQKYIERESLELDSDESVTPLHRISGVNTWVP